ncbi:uncharacterized protein LOC126830833 [Patella vulgata]|uniref:uncharacterized protein LOC126830833 n=1 Tax=Patella vulgata TaxID=6465 RepID=UPI0021802298|nr:uncharacterized protein LOC126830833 [Patella vulgata]
MTQSTLRYFLLYLYAGIQCDIADDMTYSFTDSCPDEQSEEGKLCQDPSSLMPLVYHDFGLSVKFYKNAYCVLCSNELLLDAITNVNFNYKCKNNTVPDPETMEKHLLDGTCSREYKLPESALEAGYFCDMYRDSMISVLSNDCDQCINQVQRNESEWTLQCTLCRIAEASVEFCPEGQDTDVIPGLSLKTLFNQPSNPVFVKANGKLFKGSDLCKDDENFDNIFQKCRQFYCPLGQYPKLGKCHQNTTIYIPSTSLPLPDASNTVFVDFAYKIIDLKNAIPVAKIIDKVKSTKQNVTLINGPSFKDSVYDFRFQFDMTEFPLSLLVNALSNIEFYKDTAALEIQVFNYREIDTLKKICGGDDYKCLNETTFVSKKEDLFAQMNVGNLTQFFPIENTFFNLLLSTGINITSICICDSDILDYSTKNCSASWYLYDSDEYTILEKAELHILEAGLKFPQSEYYIRQNGSALVCYDPFKNAPFFNMDTTQLYLSWVLSSISILFLILTIILNFVFKEIQKLPAKLITGLATSLVFGQCFLIFPKIGKNMCRYIAALTHLSWLSAFMWMSAQAVNMLITFHPATLHKATSWHANHVFRSYCIICLSIPLLIVGTGFILDVVPGDHGRLNYGTVECGWMSSMYGSIATFSVPVAVTLLINVICFSLTLYYLQRAIHSSQKVTGKKLDRNMCLIYIKLSSVLGFSWIFGFIATYANAPALWYVYIILNGLQGFFVFLSFTVNVTRRQMTKKASIMKSQTTTTTS